MSDTTQPKPKKTISPEQRAKMLEGSRLARERKKAEKELAKIDNKKAAALKKIEDKALLKKQEAEAKQEQKDRLSSNKNDSVAKRKIKAELEQLRDSMNIQVKKPKLPVVKEEEEPLKEEQKPEPLKEEPKPLKEEPPKKREFSNDELKSKLDEEVEKITSSMDRHTSDIFKAVAMDYNFNNSVNDNMGFMMNNAMLRIQKNKEAIDLDRLKTSKKMEVKVEKNDELEKKKRLDRLKARYAKLAKS